MKRSNFLASEIRRLGYLIDTDTKPGEILLLGFAGERIDEMRDDDLVQEAREAITELRMISAGELPDGEHVAESEMPTPAPWVFCERVDLEDWVPAICTKQGDNNSTDAGIIVCAFHREGMPNKADLETMLAAPRIAAELATIKAEHADMLVALSDCVAVLSSLQRSGPKGPVERAFDRAYAAMDAVAKRQALAMRG